MMEEEKVYCGECEHYAVIDKLKLVAACASPGWGYVIERRSKSVCKFPSNVIIKHIPIEPWKSLATYKVEKYKKSPRRLNKHNNCKNFIARQ